MKEAAVEFIAVSKRYGRHAAPAVADLSFAARKGEILGLIGPNGAGKTTALKLAAGIIRPDSGTIRVAGHDLHTGALAAKRILGYASGEPLVYDGMTGHQFLSFIARVYRVPRKEAVRRIACLVDEFGLEEACAGRIASFPPGVRQKLSLCAIFLHEPEIFILDEPFAGLDPPAVKTLVEKLKAAARNGKSVLLSTYLLDLAEKLCHRIGVMRRGGLAACDRIAALKKASGLKRPALADLFRELIR